MNTRLSCYGALRQDAVMQFKPELVREILILIEDRPAGEPFKGTISSDSSSQAEVNEHMQLLLDNGYINGQSVRDHRNVPIQFSISGLRMKGHEFLANARNNTVWKKVMAEAKEKGQSLGMTVLNLLLEQAAKKYAGL
jgi:hypothetical protein